MASPAGADDWIVPDQATAQPRASGDDWFVPDAPPATTTDKLQRAHEVIENSPIGRVEKAVGQGEAEGFGNEPLGLSPEHVKELQKTGLLHTPGQPFEPTQAISDFAIRYGAKAADAVLRAVNAGVQGIASGAGQVAREFGQSDTQAQKLTADVGTMEDLALMAPVPEALMDAPGARISSPEELAAFRQSAAQAPGAPAPVRSQTRAEIDEFLAQRAARAADATPKLPPPDDWVVPPSEASPAPASATPGVPPAPEAPVAPAAGVQATPPPAPDAGVVSADFPSFDEPGRTAPAAAPSPPVPSLKDILADPRSADELRQSGELPPPPPKPVPVAPSPGAVPKLQDLLADPRSADEIRQDLAAQAQNPTITPNVIPPPAPAAPVDLKVNTPPGTAENPVVIALPPDVHIGAENTAIPTPPQAEAGNYQKRHVKWNGLDLSIETEAGGLRKGISPQGTPWSVTLPHPYGYIKGSTGADREQVDFYLGPHPHSSTVYVVDQIDPATGAFDEHKALIGFSDAVSARQAYEAAFSDGSGNARLGDMARLTVEQFKDWLSKGQRRAPLTYSDPVRAAKAIDKQHGLNATDEEIAAAVHAHRVNNTDLTDALVAAVERNAVAEEAESPDSIQHQEAPHGGQVAPATSSETGAELAQAGQQAGPAGEEEIEQAPAGVEPYGNQPIRGAGEVETPEPELAKASDLTAARLTKLSKKIPSMTAEDRASTHTRVRDLVAQMETDGRKIAEHCLETGGKFSVRS